MSATKQPPPPGVAVSLTAIEGAPNPFRTAVSEFPFVIGDADDSDLVIKSSGLAPSHARLVWSGEGLFIEDLGNPVRVNDRTVRSVRLHNGDIIEAGRVKLLVQLAAPATPAVVEEPEAAPARAAWLAGFTEDLRNFWREDLGWEFSADFVSFRTGEEVLVALSRALTEKTPPSVIILDLKLPMINGINVAIATRAFELGFRRQNLIPLVFLFDPPDQSSFDKVVRFCQPVKAVRPGETAGLADAVRELAADHLNHQ